MDTTPPKKQPAIVKNELESLEPQIRLRAYELYEARSRKDGHDLDDWLQAEAELTEQTRPVAA